MRIYPSLYIHHLIILSQDVCRYPHGIPADSTMAMASSQNDPVKRCIQDAPRADSVTPAEDQRVLAWEAARFGPEVAPICSNSAGNLADSDGDGVVGLG